MILNLKEESTQLESIGEFDGTFVGLIDDVGAAEGDGDGLIDLVGRFVGSSLGVLVGVTLYASVGSNEGNRLMLGISLLNNVGNWVGMTVGLDEGAIQLGKTKLILNSFVSGSIFKIFIVISSIDESSCIPNLPFQSPLYSTVFPVALSKLLNTDCNIS